MPTSDPGPAVAVTADPARRRFLRAAAGGPALLALSAHLPAGARAHEPVPRLAPAPFPFEEATLADLQWRMTAGTLTARDLAAAYLARMDAIDRESLRSVIERNPDALSIAEALDRERKEKGARGPLHGIPILVKDNIDTGDRMLTTAGSLALVGAPAPRDAFLVEKLRAAGAVILGKTNLSEWANIRSTRSTSGWSARGGQTRNPYALDRNPCGSSSGSAVAVSASLCAAAVGTETDGSVVCPASANGVVGIKPTLGLVSRTGIIPIAHSQDTAGPLARTVADAAALLWAMAGADPRDAETSGAGRVGAGDHALDPRGLAGVRLGVARAFFGGDARVDKAMAEALEATKGAGAVLVDPVDLPRSTDYDATELEVLLFELKAGLAAYLAARGATSRVKTLADVIAFNEANREVEMPYFGQELFLMAQEKGPLSTRTYREALAKNRRLSRAEGIDAVLKRHRIDAIVAPTGGPAWKTDLVSGDHFTGISSSSPPAVAGYPAVTVPAGFVHGLPVGVTFMGPAWSDARLVRYAYAYEQATKARRPPRLLASVDPEAVKQ